MSASAAGSFACDGCGKSYTWKAQLAGRRVKCKCGHVLTVPKNDPAAATYETPPEGFDDLYALAEEKVVHAAPTYVRPQAVGAPSAHGGGAGRLIPAASPARAVGGKPALLGYAQMGSKRGRGAGEAAAANANVFWNPVTDLYVPAALVLLGMFLSFFEIRVVLGLKSIPVVIGAIGVLSIVNVVLAFAGILIATKLLNLGLGPIPVAILKTAAAAILPAAAASLVSSLIGFSGFFLAWIVSFTLSMVIFMKLMDMDFTETCICAVIIWAVRTWIGYLILGAIFHGMGGGSGDGTGGTGGTLLAAAGGTTAIAAATDDADSAERPANPAARYDDRALGLMQARRKPDAKTWVADPNHAFAKRTHDQSVQVVETLAGLGATFMIVPDPEPGKGQDKDKETARALVFLLPTDKDARRKIFDYYPTLGKTFGHKDVKDEGQQYMSVEFAGWFFDEDADDQTPATPDEDDDEN